MSSIAAEIDLPAKSRSLTALAWYQTRRQIGARLGLIWISILATLAVIAPLIANSHPILMKQAGRISSPMLKHFTPTDWILMIGSIVGLVIFFQRRWSIAKRIGLTVLAFVILALGFFLLLPKPAPMALEEYRMAEAEGKIEWAIRTIIPFSPTDRHRDMSAADVPHPWRPGRLGHWLGTEQNGADVLSSLIYACRIAMSVGFISTGIALVIGVVVGALMGYFATWVDLIGMRVVEVFGSIPQLYLLLAFVAFFGRDLYLIMIIIGLTSWEGDARMVRAEFLKLRKQDFVQAAEALGLPLSSILFLHLLPNAVAPLLVGVSFGIAGAILSESTLSFLGLGLVGEASWGSMLNQAVGAAGGFVWWLAVFPGLAIFLTVFSYNLIGEAFRDALDPKLQKRE